MFKNENLKRQEVKIEQQWPDLNKIIVHKNTNRNTPKQNHTNANTIPAKSCGRWATER